MIPSWIGRKTSYRIKKTTTYIEVFPKNILSKNNSPDIPFNYSINPYNGCEHGCVYCYARNSHEYWGYSAGKDFEEKILYKPKGHEMLRALFRSGKWNPELIVLSGNTDCYQPAEQEMMLTRKTIGSFFRAQTSCRGDHKKRFDIARY
jgi:DNA repair photolyase